MPTWFRVTSRLNRSGWRERWIALLRATRTDSPAWHAFWTVLAQYLLPNFFDAMFESRGVGRDFYGRRWKPLSEGWLAEKEAEGWDLRIGHRLGELRRTLVQAPEFSMSGARASWGASPRDEGRSYAESFNSVRPIIDERTARELRSYIHVEGQPAFDRAVAALKKEIGSD